MMPLQLLCRKIIILIHKTIYKIQSLKTDGQKRVALQFPEGLLLFSTTIAELLEKFTGCICIIMGNVTYGACCIDDISPRLLGCSLLVHYGHSCLVPINKTTIQTLYVFVDIEIDREHFISSIRANFKAGSKIALISTIQFVATLQTSAQELSDYEIVLQHNQPLSPGEVLGCTAPSVGDCDALIYLGDGRFHLEAGMIANPKVQAYRYDPYDQKFTRENYDHELMKKNRKGQIEQAKTAKSFGIILSTLGRQGNPKILENVIRLIEKQGKDHFTILMAEIFPDKLALFEDIDCWIQIACPRLSIDWGLGFEKPLLTPFEAAVALQEAEWQQEVYPMDFYSYKTLGNWTNNHKDNNPNHPEHREERKRLRREHLKIKS